jgi:hypothetical protein
MAKDVLLINSRTVDQIWRHEASIDRSGIARIKSSRKKTVCDE